MGNSANVSSSLDASNLPAVYTPSATSPDGSGNSHHPFFPKVDSINENETLKDPDPKHLNQLHMTQMTEPSVETQLSLNTLGDIAADLQTIIGDEDDEKQMSLANLSNHQSNASNSSTGSGLYAELPQITHKSTFFGTLISDDGDQSATNIRELILKVTDGQDVHSIPHKKVEEILLLCHKAFCNSETMLQVD